MLKMFQWVNEDFQKASLASYSLILIRYAGKNTTSIYIWLQKYSFHFTWLSAPGLELLFDDSYSFSTTLCWGKWKATIEKTEKLILETNPMT